MSSKLLTRSDTHRAVQPPISHNVRTTQVAPSRNAQNHNQQRDRQRDRDRCGGQGRGLIHVYLKIYKNYIRGLLFMFVDFFHCIYPILKVRL